MLNLALQRGNDSAPADAQTCLYKDHTLLVEYKRGAQQDLPRMQHGTLGDEDIG